MLKTSLNYKEYSSIIKKLKKSIRKSRKKPFVTKRKSADFNVNNQTKSRDIINKIKKGFNYSRDKIKKTLNSSKTKIQKYLNKEKIKAQEAKILQEKKAQEAQEAQEAKILQEKKAQEAKILQEKKAQEAQEAQEAKILQEKKAQEAQEAPKKREELRLALINNLVIIIGIFKKYINGDDYKNKSTIINSESVKTDEKINKHIETVNKYTSIYINLPNILVLFKQIKEQLETHTYDYLEPDVTLNKNVEELKDNINKLKYNIDAYKTIDISLSERHDNDGSIKNIKNFLMNIKLNSLDDIYTTLTNYNLLNQNNYNYLFTQINNYNYYMRNLRYFDMMSSTV